MDEFQAVQRSLKQPGVAGWWVGVLEAVGEDRRAALLAAGRNAEISHRAIAVVLKGWGFNVTTAQVGHWRRTHVG